MNATTPEEMDRLNRRVAELRGWVGAGSSSATWFMLPLTEGRWEPTESVDGKEWFIQAKDWQPCTDARQAMALLEEMPYPSLSTRGGPQPAWELYLPRLPRVERAAEPCVAIVKAWIAHKEAQP